MADNFIEQQHERVGHNQEMLNEVHRLFVEKLTGRKFSETGNDNKDNHPKEIEIEPISLPNRNVGMADLLKVMAKQITLWDLGCVCAATLGITLMGMFLPYITKQFYDEMIPSSDSSLLFPLGALLISATIGSSLFNFSRAMVLLRIRDKMSAALQSSLIERVLHLPTSFFREFSAGKLGDRIMQIGQVMHELSYKAMGALLALVFAVLYFFQINTYAPKLMTLSVVSLLCQFVVMGLFSYYASKEQNRVRKSGAELSGMLYNLLEGIQKIKSSAAEERVYARWAKLYIDSIVNRADRSRFLIAYPALTALIATATTVLTYKYTMEYKIQLSDYASYLSAYGMVLAAVNALSALLPELVSLRPAFDLCDPILKCVPEERDEREKVEALSGAIDIANLSFRYNSNSPYIFRDLNLHIKPGEYVGIVGPSGCGKSTLMRLLLGFETAETGSIFYDQYSIQSVNIQSLRQKIGTCLQNGRIFQDSIYSNIVITRPTATEEEVWEAARLACIDEDIHQMPMGLHTLIGEGGGGLSGGQCQRLLLARVLVARPNIIFLDEATSALDNVTQRCVIENLDALQCTRICVAHRLSTVRHCSRIIVLDKGQVAEEGTFEELMALKGKFYELTKRQL